ncbi:MAG: signal peptide peptidase SppA [Sandaracinaceae bacterium]|nr:signal peptide peptidase SppA [Myxococcales bacterium]MCB9662352.1 signal peptide peptidase SppA [Sandaracinaceae bacterium]
MPSSRCARTLSLAFSCLIAVPCAAAAQTRPASAGVEAPARLWTAPEGALTLATHPAAMGWVDGVRVRFVHVGSLTGAHLAAGEGTGVYGVAGLPFGIGLGFSAERVQATDGLGNGADYGRLSLGLAWAASRSFSIGGNLSYIGGGELDGVTALGLSVGLRPSRFMEFSLAVHDLLGPLGLVTADVEVPATFHFAAALLSGDSRFRAEVGYARSTDNVNGLRGAITARVPSFGDVVAQVEVDNIDQRAGRPRDVRVTGGFEADWGGHTLGGGVAGRFDPSASSFYVTGEFGGPSARGLPEPRYVADVEVRDFGPRGLINVIHVLDRALHERDVAGVVLRPRTRMGLAQAQEVRVMVDALMAAGKRVVCHLESASGGEWYACAGAERTYIDPGGSVQLLGPSLEMMTLGRLLENAGVRADFVRIGEYKSAPEQFMNETLSEPAREEYDVFLDDVYRRFTEDLARDASLEPAAVRSWVDGGPYVAPQALAAHLVDEELGAEGLQQSARELIGSRVRMGLRRHRDDDGPRRGVGVVVVDGAIVDGDNVDIPLVEIHQSGARTLVRTLDAYASDPNIAAIVLRIDSPGGSALASEQVWRAVRRARQHKPVIASLGSVAASGGYYIASAADEIWADPSTLTGSIGIYYGKVDFQDLAERLGVHVELLGRGARSSATSMYRPFTDDERERLRELITEMYQLFLRRVAEGRGMTTEEVDAVGQGRVWSGDRARQLGLVDRLGGFGSALARARERAHLAAGCRVRVAPARPGGLLDYVLGSSAPGSAELGGSAPEVAASVAGRGAAALDWMVMMSQVAELGALAHLPAAGVVE